MKSQTKPSQSGLPIESPALSPYYGAPTIGKWYLASYGFEYVNGQCVDVLPEGMILKFRWGLPFRTRQYVDHSRVLGQVSDPRWITRLLRLFAR